MSSFLLLSAHDALPSSWKPISVAMKGSRLRPTTILATLHRRGVVVESFELPLMTKIANRSTIECSGNPGVPPRSVVWFFFLSLFPRYATINSIRLIHAHAFSMSSGW